MSCEIKNSYAVKIENLTEIQQYFGLAADKNWVSCIWISQLYDLLVFGHGSKLVILHSKFDKESHQKVYNITNKLLLNENFIITSLQNFPICGGSNYIDWVCIIIGVDSGNLLFFSDQGNQFYEKHFLNEPVLGIKAHSSDELFVSYSTCIIEIPLNSLIPILKSLKDSRSRSNFQLEDLNLVYKKWDYKNREISIADSCVVGQQKSNCLFDHLLNESLEGLSKKYRHTPTQNALVVTTGGRPYISFHSAREGFKNSVFTDVAKAVTNKLISKLPSWLTGSQPPASTSNDQKIQNENVSEFMYPKFELIDYQRVGNNIWLSPPNYQLAVIADNLGRIVMIDLNKGIMIRMWKGYRDAQCGFVEVIESKSKKEQKSEHRRSGLFLVIYAPQKSCIEIWSLQRGPKVATFQCSKNGYLLYNIHNETSLTKPKNLKTTCNFLDAQDGMLKEFLIPFHCTLSEGSKSSEDFHFLKKLKLCLKNFNFKDSSGSEDILEICKKVQSDVMRSKTLEILVTSRKIDPNVIKPVIEYYLQVLEKDVESEEDCDRDKKFLLYAHCRNYEKLINCFIALNQVDEIETSEKVEEQIPEDQEKMEVDEMPEKSSESFELSEYELSTIKKVIELATTQKVHLEKTIRNVTFDEPEDILVPFLASFQINNSILSVNEEVLNVYDTIGNVLFSNYWNDKKKVGQSLLDILNIAGLPCEEVMKAFLHFWQQQELSFENGENILKEMCKFKANLKVITDYAGEKTTYAYNTICVFWQEVREYLLESEKPMNALLSAIICKNQALMKSENDESSFEQVSQEEAQWSLLIGKLDDVAVLTIFISSGLTKPNSNSDSLSTKYEAPKVTLKHIINGGKGVISELVCNWIIGTKIDVNLLFVADSETIKDDLSENDKIILQKLCMLKQHFPFSLNSSVLLCYITWNLMCQWSKNLTDFVYLKQAMKYLSMLPEKAYELKHGLCILMWNAHFKLPLKATKKIINKTGRLPKEKFCMQDIGISDTLVPEFLSITIYFMDHFKNSFNYSKIQMKYEEILQEGPVSLCELILQQNRGNLDLVKLHYELFLVLELIAFFNIKYQKPVQTLFDDVANESFFADINKNLKFTLTSADEIRQNTRVAFLCKAITASVDLIFEDMQSLYLKDHLMWMEKIKKLCKIWCLNEENLNRQQVITLYVNGYDSYAEELLEKIRDREKISSILLDIAGQRLNLHLRENKGFWAQVSASGTLVTNYLDSLAKKGDDPLIQSIREVSIEKLSKLSYKVYQLCSSANNDSRILRTAGQLLDVCVTIKDSS